MSMDVRQIQPHPLPADMGGASCALSVDVEDWFHAANLRVPPGHWASMPSRIERSVDTLLRLLAKYDTHATFFILGWIADRHPNVVRRVREAGHEIASHGYWHRPVHSMTQAGFVDDLDRSIEAISKACSFRPLGYRAPSYSIDHRAPWAYDVLDDLGFRYDSSVYPARALHGRYGSSNGPLRPFRPRPGLWEFPLPTLSVCGRRFPAATGAYLRILPLAVTVRTIEQNLSDRIPVVINVHPWELDPDQPRIAAPWWGRTLHYTALHRTYGKLEQLLRRYQFVTLDAMVNALEDEQIVKAARAPKHWVLPPASAEASPPALDPMVVPDPLNENGPRTRSQDLPSR